jgi:hypothetical protein
MAAFTPNRDIFQSMSSMRLQVVCLALAGSELFAVLRRANLRVIARASPIELKRVGVHVERGEESLENSSVGCTRGTICCTSAKSNVVRRAVA